MTDPTAEAPWPGDTDTVRLSGVRTLSDDWYTLRKYTFELKRRDGDWQSASREAYDRGDGCTVLLFDPTARRVALTRQFRLPTYVNGNPDGMLIETAAGLLDALDPETAIIKEVREETGYAVARVEPVLRLFMSPGAVTEKLHFFLAEIRVGDRLHDGGGEADEGEDIELVELDFDEALAMIARGEICDAKTVILLYHMRVTGRL
ncbi:NUDIX domain-containing protein [Mangrovibrevibacter kandeliae]|uniref:NUDIX domain-containing protein n=1 Tax=Mangrovibrevibacter kandeliae TaxID=2968473 RepID=UPI002117FCE9|nr:NUDIX domain-containing protein [Aurantimonas sp. CSK15Z-1]MCQ8781955.1 NUDIX domain-containing protein [Aurantimonas sp. CSK15Z-1]